MPRGEPSAGNASSPVPDLAEVIRFFKELLGFTRMSERPAFAYVHREAVGSGLMTRCEEDGPMPQRSGFTYCIEIEAGRPSDGASRAVALGRAWTVAQGYGRRELMIQTPDRHLPVFEQQTETLGRSKAPRCVLA